ncbi:nucleolin-like isoform X3 [Mirounga angustirostris]|uniref:nucleolin-like isoform X3 n=1 Tax=Mirounga angustirostris TaxID=9716 RepID=UPI00313EF70B
MDAAPLNTEFSVWKGRQPHGPRCQKTGVSSSRTMRRETGALRRKKIRRLSWARMRKSLPQKTADKRKKEMAKQKASPETRRQKLEGWNAKTLLIQNLSHRVTQHELKEVFKDAFQIRLVSKDGMSKRIAYVDFKSQADAERALDEKRGTKIGGLAVVLGHVEEKSQGREGRALKIWLFSKKPWCFSLQNGMRHQDLGAG